MKNRISYKKSCLRENQDKKKRGLERNRREKIYDWIAIYFEETIHWRYSFYEQCLYDMATIEITSGFLGCWDWPKHIYVQKSKADSWPKHYEGQKVNLRCMS